VETTITMRSIEEQSKKYTFVEFVAAWESDDFDDIEPSWLRWAEHLIENYGKLLNAHHLGDCTKTPISCNLCVLESLLTDYREYYFNEEEWRKNNL
jgi:hypothetical protein